MGECFEQDNIFPIIQEVIRQVCEAKTINRGNDDTDFALHDEITRALLSYEQGHAEIRAAIQRCPHHSETWMADNMVQWWSQRYTTRSNEWSGPFQRKKIRGSWAYKPRPTSLQTVSEEEIYSKSIQLSKKIWPILIDLASVRRTITYKELGARLHIYGQALQNFDRILAPIKYYCIYHKLPPLSALVVCTGMGLPGSGAEADEVDIDNVFVYDWKSRRPLIPNEDEFADAINKARK
jgi:hypothetical protein